MLIPEHDKKISSEQKSAKIAAPPSAVGEAQVREHTAISISELRQRAISRIKQIMKWPLGLQVIEMTQSVLLLLIVISFVWLMQVVPLETTGPETWGVQRQLGFAWERSSRSNNLVLSHLYHKNKVFFWSYATWTRFKVVYSEWVLPDPHYKGLPVSLP